MYILYYIISFERGVDDVLLLQCARRYIRIYIRECDIGTSEGLARHQRNSPARHGCVFNNICRRRRKLRICRTQYNYYISSRVYIIYSSEFCLGHNIVHNV